MKLIATARLNLVSATITEIDALIASNRLRFESLIGASTKVPLVPPPETGDALAWFRKGIADDESIRPWWFRWVIEREGKRLVGSAGFTGYPNDDREVTIGYSVYPEFEGKGYASEAAAGLVAWALAQERVKCVQATIFPGHIASEHVAAKTGLRFLREIETNDGVLGLWSVCKVSPG